MLIRQGTAVYAYDFTKRDRIPEWEYVKSEGVRGKSSVPKSSDSDYWRDVGTLEQYWLANLDLVQPHPRFNVYGEHFPLYSAPGHSPREIRPRDAGTYGHRGTRSSPTASS